MSLVLNNWAQSFFKIHKKPESDYVDVQADLAFTIPYAMKYYFCKKKIIKHNTETKKKKKKKKMKKKKCELETSVSKLCSIIALPLLKSK